MKENSVLKSKLFLRLFGIPAAIWQIIMILALIPDKTNSEQLTLDEGIITDIFILLVWFSISFLISIVIIKLDKKNKNTEEKEEIEVKEIKEEKKKENYLYKIESIVDAYEYKRMSKFFPKRTYWVFVKWNTLYTLLFTAIIIFITRSPILASFFFVIRQIYIMCIYSVRLEHFAEKSFNRERKKYNVDINFETEFYDNYFISKNNGVSRTVSYNEITRCVETDTNFYLECQENKAIIIIQKNACDLEVIDFIRSKFKNIENKLGDEIKFKGHLKPKTIKIFMLVLFIATILSIYGAMYTLILVGTITKQHDLSFFKNIWIFWCFVPIPLASIILGYKYRNLGFKCTKNIVAGYIVGIFLILYGSFFLIIPSYKEDYSKINDYIEYIDATIPSDGYLEIINYNTHYESDKTNYKSITAYYDKEDTTILEESIESSRNWLKSSEVKSNLKIFMSVRYNSNDTYYLVYNKTTGEYNTVPSEAGEYEIYTMMYDKKNKMLVIDTYNYSYR